MTKSAAQPGILRAGLPVRTTTSSRHAAATPQTTLMLDADKHAPAAARRAVANSLTRWKLSRLIEDAQAVTCELVTNAVIASTKHAPEGTTPRAVILTITAERAELTIRVSDPDPTPPPESSPAPGRVTVDGGLAESGRGLTIVAALSDRWGTSPAPNGGKSVYAVLKPP